MEYKLGETLISEELIAARVKRMAEEIKRDFLKEHEGEELLLVGILKGSAVFLTDLARAMGDDVDVRLDFMVLSSYGAGTKSSGIVRIVKDLDTYIEGKNVMIAEDIIDSGLTMSYLLSVLRGRNPKSLKVCAMLNKQDRRKAEISADYCGFEIPDEFVVGYGLDYSEKWRHLRDVRVAVPVS